MTNSTDCIQSEVVIRRLSQEDGEEFFRLRLEALETSPSSFGASYHETLKGGAEKLAERLKPTDDAFVFGAFCKGELVGILGFVRNEGAKVSHKGFIWGVYVTSKMRRSGVARSLATHAIACARQLGLDQLHLSVTVSNHAAVKLYKSLGFETYGTEPSAIKIGDETFDEFLMVLKPVTPKAP